MSLAVAAALGVVVGVVATCVATNSDIGTGQPARVESFQRTGDPRQLVVVVTVGLGDKVVETSARETDTTVTPIIRVRSPGGARPAVGILVATTILLREGIGTRAVVDEQGRPVLDLGTYFAPREPPVDLGEIGIVQPGTFRMDGEKVDVEWRSASGASTFTLSQLRGATVVLLSRTSFSNDGKLSLLALQGRLAAMSREETARIVVVVITLNEDPQRAAIVRPSTLYRPLVAFPDTTGAEAPEILRFASVPVMWFLGPEGAIRYRVERRAATTEDVERGLAAAR